jgi:hypothetical protein
MTPDFLYYIQRFSWKYNPEKFQYHLWEYIIDCLFKYYIHINNNNNSKLKMIPR